MVLGDPPPRGGFGGAAPSALGVLAVVPFSFSFSFFGLLFAFLILHSNTTTEIRM